MRARPAATRLAAAAAVVALAGTAVAATAGPAPATGTASSALTLLSLNVGGHSIAVGRVALSSNLSSGSVVVTPLAADGTSYAEKSVTTGSVAVPSVRSDGLPSAITRLAGLSSPIISAGARKGSARAGTESLGGVRVLGLPVALDGSIRAETAVDAAHAGAQKTLTVRNLALPSIGQLLAALGLDVSKLPVATLTTLVQQLGLVTGPVGDAITALDTALAPLQPQLTAAQQQVADASAAVTKATQDVAAKQAQVDAAAATLTSASQDLQAALGTTPALRKGALLGLPSPSPLDLLSPSPLPSLSVSPLPSPLPSLSVSPLPSLLPSLSPSPLPSLLPSLSPSPLPSILPTALPSLPATLSPDLQALVDAYDAASATYSGALAAVNDATGVLDTANSLLGTASAALDTLLSTVKTQVDAVVAAVTGVLDNTPLVKVDSFTITTTAAVTSAGAGGQTAEVVGGELQGVHVLGTDVLSDVLHRDRIALTDLLGTPLEQLTARIDALTGVLSSVLSNVPELPTLSVPAPKVDLLSMTTATGSSGGFGTARNTVSALRISLPAITIPSAVLSPGLVTTQALGDLVSSPLTLAVGTLVDSAQFAPAQAATGTTVPGSTVPGTTVPGTTVPGSTTPGTSPAGTSPTSTSPTSTSPTGTVPAGSTPTAAGPAGSSPQLPRTGLPVGVALLALALTSAGLVLQRRTA